MNEAIAEAVRIFSILADAAHDEVGVEGAREQALAARAALEAANGLTVAVFLFAADVALTVAKQAAEKRVSS